MTKSPPRTTLHSHVPWQVLFPELVFTWALNVETTWMLQNVFQSFLTSISMTTRNKENIMLAMKSVQMFMLLSEILF